MKIAIAQQNSVLGDYNYNATAILNSAEKALEQGYSLIIFPEMFLSGYPAEDWLQYPGFIQNIRSEISWLAARAPQGITILFGAPILEDGELYNAAIKMENKSYEIAALKRSLPNYGVFNEKRFFKTADESYIHKIDNLNCGVAICEDIWTGVENFSTWNNNIDIILVLNSSPFEIYKEQQRIIVAKEFAKHFKVPLVYCNMCGAQDDLVFDGGSFVLGADGGYIIEPQFWQQGLIEYSSATTASKNSENFDEEEHIYSAAVMGLRDYAAKNNFTELVVCLSCEFESALVAIIAADALGPQNVKCIMMPFKTTDKTSVAKMKELAKKIGCSINNISIERVCNIANSLLKQETQPNAEGLNSNIRGAFLDHIANQENILLLCNSNKSNNALGITKCNGRYAPIKDVYKTQVYQIAVWRNNNIPQIGKLQKSGIIPDEIILQDIDELEPAGVSIPYNIVDQILMDFIEKKLSAHEIEVKGYNANDINKIITMVIASEYRRKQDPPSPKVNSVHLTRDRRCPITFTYLK